MPRVEEFRLFPYEYSHMLQTRSSSYRTPKHNSVQHRINDLLRWTLQYACSR